MTLPVTDSWEIDGLEGPKYQVGPRCANPTCDHWAEHAHHIVRRSFLGGNYHWIAFADGNVRGNLTGLCPDCHDEVTGLIGGHKSAIRYEDGVFLWCAVVEVGPQLTYEPVGALDPQPPTLDSLAAEASPTASESEPCPTCGQKRRRSSPTIGGSGEPRRRKSWTIKVPDDSEDGALVLDTLIDDLAPLLHVEHEGEYRYYVVVPALAYAQQNRARFIESVAGRGE